MDSRYPSALSRTRGSSETQILIRLLQLPAFDQSCVYHREWLLTLICFTVYGFLISFQPFLGRHHTSNICAYPSEKKNKEEATADPASLLVDPVSSLGKQEGGL